MNIPTGEKQRMLKVLDARWAVGEAARSKTAINVKVAALIATGALALSIAAPMGATAFAEEAVDAVESDGAVVELSYGSVSPEPVLPADDAEELADNSADADDEQVGAAEVDGEKAGSEEPDKQVSEGSDFKEYWSDEKARPAQSETVKTQTPAGEDLEAETTKDFDVILNKDKKCLQVVYVISADAKGDQIIDLTKAHEAAVAWAKAQGSDAYYWEPGDVIPYEIVIKSESSHTYTYKQGSFTLSTPSMGEQTTGAIAFDGQELPEQYLSPETIAIQVPYLQFYKEGSDLTNDMLKIAADAAYELFLKQPTSGYVYKGVKAAFEKQTEYTDFDEFTKYYLYKNATGVDITDGLVSGFNEKGQRKYGIDWFLKTYFNENYGSAEGYFLAYFNERYGSSYEDLGTLLAVNSDAVRDLNVTGVGTLVTLNVKTDQAVEYNNFYQNLISFAYGNDEFSKQIQEVAGDIHLNTPVGEIKKIDKQHLIELFVDKYQWTEEDAEWLWWYTATWNGDGETFDNEKYTYYVKTESGEVLTIFELCDQPWFASFKSNDDGTLTVKDGGKSYVVTPVCELGIPYFTADNDSWTNDGNRLTIADYMKGKLDESGAWKQADEYFQKLLAGGLDAEKAAGIAFSMCVNLDGELTGNSYQDTAWSWYNSIVLNQLDGDLTVVKYDDKGNILGDDKNEKNASFYLWYVDDRGTSDKSDDACMYYTKIPSAADGEDVYGFVEYDPEAGLTWTIDASNGKLQISDTLLETIVYYLQEAVAPTVTVGSDPKRFVNYDLDANIYVICNEDQLKQLKDENGNVVVSNVASGEKSVEAVWIGKGIDSDNPLTINVVNKAKQVKPTPTPDPIPDPDPVPDPVPDPEPTPDPKPIPDPTTNDNSSEIIGSALPRTGDSEVPFAFGLVAMISGALLLASRKMNGKHAPKHMRR